MRAVVRTLASLVGTGDRSLSPEEAPGTSASPSSLPLTHEQKPSATLRTTLTRSTAIPRVSTTSTSTDFVLPIDKNWEFAQQQTDSNESVVEGGWLGTSKFPTDIHSELLKLKKIPDPFIGLHEYDVQCECSVYILTPYFALQVLV